MGTSSETAIESVVKFVKSELKDAEAGHDWFHIHRVWNLSKIIAKNEKGNLFIIELGALLHDIADSKFHDGDEHIGPQKARKFLESLKLELSVIDHVVKILQHISFKGGNFDNGFESPELSIVQDADRLDAMGAIGIARAFHFGGFKNRPLYDPDILPVLDMSRETYKKSSSPTLNHFHEKLLLLKDRMNTKTGEKIAIERHRFMVEFLKQFKSEWNLT